MLRISLCDLTNGEYDIQADVVHLPRAIFIGKLKQYMDLSSESSSKSCGSMRTEGVPTASYVTTMNISLFLDTA